MSFIINRNSIGEKLIKADFFKIEGDFAWFFKNETQVVSINRIDFINEIEFVQ